MVIYCQRSVKIHQQKNLTKVSVCFIMRNNEKKIAYNTILLYTRMLFTMLVSLYTSRIVLNALGVEDFGLYNVISGVIGMMSFFNNTMATAIQRFLNFEMGKGNFKSLSHIFSTSIICYIVIISVIILIGETLGIWFIENKLTIPTSRQNAVFWVYQFSLFTFILNMLTIPYTAIIIAYEKMTAFAYISIFEVIGKLLTAYFIVISPIDKLIFYSQLITAISFIILLCYVSYCYKYFPNIKFLLLWDKQLFLQLFRFSGWMISGTIAQMFSTQGINILLNIFFGPIFNAARAIGIQIFNAVNNFVANFMVAARPQIVKSYANNDLDYTYKLIFTTSKLSFYLLFILSISLLFEIDFILRLWLKTPPIQANFFTQLIILDLFITTAYSPLGALSQASGKIRNYQLIIAACFLSTFFISWISFALGSPAYSCFIIIILIDTLGLFARLFELKNSIQFPMKKYLYEAMYPIITVLIITIIVCIPIYKFITISNIYGFILRCFLYIFFTLLVIYFRGINKTEKQYIQRILLKKRI